MPGPGATAVAVIGFLDEDDALHQTADAKIQELLGRERLKVSV